jgi:putative flavoprotein involved in K+ transport
VFQLGVALPKDPLPASPRASHAVQPIKAAHDTRERMIHEHVGALIIGAGQAGLTMSHMLARRGIRHAVVERARVAERWRSERWSGLAFQFPNWSIALPDFPFAHADPDGFATRDQIVAFLDAYAAFVAPPLRLGVEIKRLTRSPNPGFIADTGAGTLRADNVVVATGPYQRPVIPRLALDPSIFRVHASHYRDPQQLPAGSVLVIGSGSSGAQIAEELHRAGRAVLLSVGRHRRVPRRYRGWDFIRWLHALGLYETPVEQRGPERAQPLVTGAYGGYTLDYRDLAARGVELVGRVTGARGDLVDLADDLHDNLARGDAAYRAFLERADEHVARNRLDVHDDPAARAVLSDPPCLERQPREIDLRSRGVNAVVFATGYAVDFSWIDLPCAVAADGNAIHSHGIAAVPGLYFLGLQWMSKMKSSFLSGVGDDAARLADHIAARS